MGNKWLEEVLASERVGGYNPVDAVASSIVIRQYQRNQGFPLLPMKFKVAGQWRDIDEIMAGPDA